jgi:primosomal protein N'
MKKQRMTVWECEYCRRLYSPPARCGQCEAECATQAKLKSFKERLEEAKAELQAALGETP